MTRDLVKRLRELTPMDPCDVMTKAAERIDELEKALRKIEYLDSPQVRGKPRRIEIGAIAKAALEKTNDQ